MESRPGEPGGAVHYPDQTPGGNPLEHPHHLILDNYGTHNQSKVKAWLEKHPRFNLHFTPTISSWLNLVERWSGS